MAKPFWSRILTPLSTDEYNVGIVRAPISTLLTGQYPSNVQWLPKSCNTRYQADPFGVYRNNHLYVFYERLAHHTDNAEIAVVEVFSDGRVTKPRPVIKSAIHFSYPFLLEDKGTLYCIPETRKTREIALYRCTDFPFSWTRVSALISDIDAADSTILRYDNRWWLFCATKSNTMSDEGMPESAFLSLWYADELSGPWAPHKRNPIKVDIHSARPAGTPFIHDGVLYRPAQDCAPTYGCRTVFNRVKTLSTEAYSEEKIAVIAPGQCDRYPNGIHTISAVGDLTLIDGYRSCTSFNPYCSFMKFLRWTRRHIIR